MKFYSARRCAPYCDWKEVYLEEVHRGAHAENGVWVVGQSSDNENAPTPISSSNRIPLARAA